MSGKRFTNQAGMSLVEVTIAAAISVIVALGVMKINETSQKGLNSVRDSSEIEELKRNIIGHLVNTDKCTASRFANGAKHNWTAAGSSGATQPPNATGALNHTPFTAAGNNFRIVTRTDGSAFEQFTVGQEVPWTSRWVLDGFNLFTIDAYDAGTRRGMCHVSMTLSKKAAGQAFGPDSKTIFFTLDCGMNVAGTNIESCTSLNTLSEGLWQLSTSPSTVMFASGATAVLGGAQSTAATANFDIVSGTAPAWPAGGAGITAGVRVPLNRGVIMGDVGFFSPAANQLRTSNGVRFGINGAPHGSYSLQNNGDFLNTNWVRTLGNNGLYFESWGGGWHMTDSTWIRTYGSKNVYVNTLLRSDGGLQSYGATTLGDGNDVTTVNPTLVVTGWATANAGVDAGTKLWADTVAGSRLHSAGDITGANRLYLAAGSYASNHYSASDERYKKDIETITNASEKLSEIRGVTYLLRRDEFPEMNFDAGRKTGFIAQEVQKVFPDLVVENEQTGYLNVEYSKFTAVLVEAFKEQQAEIRKNKEMFEIMKNGLQAKNAEQDARIEKLEQENKELRDEVRALSRRLDALIEKLDK